MRLVPIVSFIAVLCVPLLAHADDTVDTQRKTVETNLKQATIKATSQETDSLLVFTSFPQPTTDALAKGLQQSYYAASKELDFSSEEPPYKGKLTVIVLNDARDFKNYILRVERKAPPLNETQFLSLDSETPTIVIGVALGSRTDEKALINDAATWVGASVLQAKLGPKTPVPTWLKQSFGMMIDLHRPGNERALNTHRTTLKTLYQRSNGKLFQSWEMTPDSLGQYSNIIHTSALEAMAYGTYNEKFVPFMQSFRPAENNEPNSFNDGLKAMAIEWKDFDATWRKWLITRK